MAKLPEFFTKRQQVGPKDPDPADLEICQKKTKKPRTSTDDVANVAQSPEELADEARYRSIDHLIKLVNLIVLNFESNKNLDNLTPLEWIFFKLGCKIGGFDKKKC